MALEQPTPEDEAKQAQADFDAGAEMETLPDKPAAAPEPAKPEEKPEPEKPEATAEEAAATEPAKPKYVRITQEQFAKWDAAAREAETLKQQMSKAFGTLGDVQQIVKSLQSQTPRGEKVEIPKEAFADMARDFPELAEQIHRGVETALQGKLGTGSASAEVDPQQMRRMVAEQVTQLSLEALDDAQPEWKAIVGAVRADEQPDPNNEFRKWLFTKDGAYQARVNGTFSAGVILRAIELFQKETKAPASSQPAKQGGTLTQKYFAAQARQARSEQLRAAIQPRGDGGPPAAGRTAQDDFEEGFNSR